MSARLGGACLAAVAVFLCFSGSACGDCAEGLCECADGTKIRVASAPCECRAVCEPYGGVCRDDFAGCPLDGGDAATDAGDAEAWPWPWDASAG
ncbi:MAG: hypothetical protein IT377_24055 [Polyangiaceae bacterium]|nr:hypothetical protein [Polyangiaceae bacterium]